MQTYQSLDYSSYYKKARSKGEISTLIITFLIVLILSMFLTIEKYTLFNLLKAAITLVLIMLGSLFVIRLFQKQFLGNGLHVDQKNFSGLKDIESKIAALLRMPEPDLFVFQNPALNAFALGFKKPFTIALHSATIEGLDNEEIAAVLAHETAHIWFGHTKYSAFFSPIGQNIPALTWIFGFWSRKAELSCDRLALLLTRNPRAVIDGLIKIHVGPKFQAYSDTQGILFQDYKTKDLLSQLAQTLSSHPFMTIRIKEILRFSNEMQLAYIDKQGKQVCINCGLKIENYTSNCPRCKATLYKQTNI